MGSARGQLGDSGVGASPASVKRSVRPSTPADAAAIVALLTEVGLQPSRNLQHLQWKYWHARADWPGPRSFVVTSGGEPIAHAALIPGACSWRDRHIKTVHMIDWAARRSEAGAGSALMKYIAQHADALLAIGGSADTLRILPYMGFRSAGVVTGYVRTLSPLRLLEAGQIPAVKLLPRLARSVAWTLTAPAPRVKGWEARRLAAEDADAIAGVLPVATDTMGVTQRGVELFRHVLSCPIAPMALFAVERTGRAAGYFLLAYLPGQVRIADCWLDSDRARDWRALILCAVAQARREPHAAEVVIWASDPLLAGALEASGFHARSRMPLQIRPAAASSVPAASLRVQMLDNDAAFYHTDGPELWA